MRLPKPQSIATTTLAALLFGVLATSPTMSRESANWPSFRGGDALSVADDDPRLPVSWSETENVVWKAPIKGLGWSSPVVWGNRIFVTTAVSDGEGREPRMKLYFPFGSPETLPPGDTRFPEPKEGDLMERSQHLHHFAVYAIDFDDGRVVWETEVHAEAPTFDRHLKNSYASATPVTDGQRVYAYFGNVGVFALDMDGAVVWEKRFEPRATRLGWGPAASPVLHEDTLFVVNDNDDESFVVALDAATGDERWRVERDEGTNWSTPFVWQNEERTELITAGSDQVPRVEKDDVAGFNPHALNLLERLEIGPANGRARFEPSLSGGLTRQQGRIKQNPTGHDPITKGVNTAPRTPTGSHDCLGRHAVVSLAIDHDVAGDRIQMTVD